MRIGLSVGDQSATATLANNPTARDLAALLPLTLTMNDLLGLEKPGSLPRALRLVRCSVVRAPGGVRASPMLASRVGRPSRCRHPEPPTLPPHGVRLCPTAKPPRARAWSSIPSDAQQQPPAEHEGG
jgi:hypothetical protein